MPANMKLVFLADAMMTSQVLSTIEKHMPFRHAHGIGHFANAFMTVYITHLLYSPILSTSCHSYQYLVCYFSYANYACSLCYILSFCWYGMQIYHILFIYDDTSHAAMLDTASSNFARREEGRPQQLRADKPCYAAADIHAHDTGHAHFSQAGAPAVSFALTTTGRPTIFTTHLRRHRRRRAPTPMARAHAASAVPQYQYHMMLARALRALRARGAPRLGA